MVPDTQKLSGVIDFQIGAKLNPARAFQYAVCPVRILRAPDDTAGTLHSKLCSIRSEGAVQQEPDLQ